MKTNVLKITNCTPCQGCPYLKASLVPRRVEVRGSFEVPKLNFIGSLVTTNVQWKLRLQEFVALMPLNLYTHDVVIQNDIIDKQV